MNIDKLKIAMITRRMTAESLASAAGIHLNTMYSRLRGTTEFKQSEISEIAKALELTDQDIIEIFFEKQVS